MKKTTLILFILAACALAFIPSCDDGGKDTTELRWTNNSGQNNIVEIQWVDWENADDIDQQWNGEITNGTTTEFKEVNVLNGQGLASDGETSFQIRDANNDDNFILNEGSSETITIDNLL